MWSDTAAIATVPDTGTPESRSASIATIWHTSAAFMSMIPCPYTAPSISSPENGVDFSHPCDTGLVSMCPVMTTRGPSPKRSSPIALGRSGSTSCSLTSSKPESAMTPRRCSASGPSSPRMLGMRHTSCTSETSRSSSIAATTLAVVPVSSWVSIPLVPFRRYGQITSKI